MKRLFTAEEFLIMDQAGVFDPDEWVELLEGEFVTMHPISPRHASCSIRLNTLLHRLLGSSVLIGVKSPTRLNNLSLLRPDITVLEPREDFYASGHPRPSHIRLLIELSDTNQDYDRLAKGPVYAVAGVSEYWLVDLAAEVVEVYT